MEYLPLHLSDEEWAENFSNREGDFLLTKRFAVVRGLTKHGEEIHHCYESTNGAGL